MENPLKTKLNPPKHLEFPCLSSRCPSANRLRSSTLDSPARAPTRRPTPRRRPPRCCWPWATCTRTMWCTGTSNWPLDAGFYMALRLKIMGFTLVLACFTMVLDLNAVKNYVKSHGFGPINVQKPGETHGSELFSAPKQPGELPLRVFGAQGCVEADRLRVREDLGPVHPHAGHLKRPRGGGKGMENDLKGDEIILNMHENS